MLNLDPTPASELVNPWDPEGRGDDLPPFFPKPDTAWCWYHKADEPVDEADVHNLHGYAG